MHAEIGEILGLKSSFLVTPPTAFVAIHGDESLWLDNQFFLAFSRCFRPLLYLHLESGVFNSSGHLGTESESESEQAESVNSPWQA